MNTIYRLRNGQVLKPETRRLGQVLVQCAQMGNTTVFNFTAWEPVKAEDATHQFTHDFGAGTPDSQLYGEISTRYLPVEVSEAMRLHPNAVPADLIHAAWRSARQDKAKLYVMAAFPEMNWEIGSISIAGTTLRQRAFATEMQGEGDEASVITKIGGYEVYERTRLEGDPARRGMLVRGVMRLIFWGQAHGNEVHSEAEDRAGCLREFLRMADDIERQAHTFNPA